MSASLVGSEMCIRDRGRAPNRKHAHSAPNGSCRGQKGAQGAPSGSCPVSYTHLTLPTICSV
eukprot:8353544-Alexandrium_andersonii.AAC.1